MNFFSIHTMRFIRAIPVFLLLANIANAQSFQWENARHKFKAIREGAKIIHAFQFRNTGKVPLLITYVVASCGCTVPKNWPQDPIAPRKKGTITLSFDTSGRVGYQRKTATIISNAIEGETEISLEGEVLPKQDSIMAQLRKK